MAVFTLVVAAGGLAASTFLVAAGSQEPPPPPDVAQVLCRDVNTGSVHASSAARCAPRTQVEVSAYPPRS